MTDFVTARWADAEHARIRAETADNQTFFIPADPGNADYARLIEAAMPIADFAEPQVSWAAIRAERNARLTATDWTKLSDAPLGASQSAAFAAYRQALRDLPDQFPDPASVVWPVEPEA